MTAVPSGRAIGVNGKLLKWARLEQALTMRWVREHGGPCPGYQSEVEHGAKTEVTSEMLAAWVRALNVTESFARGEVPVFHRQPSECRGLAGHVAGVVAAVGGWETLSPNERTRRVLQRIPQESGRLPRVVLAHVLGLSVEALDAMSQGTHPIVALQMKAIAELTALPERFFKYGELEGTDDEDLLGRFLPALRLARKAGITPEQLESLVRRL